METKTKKLKKTKKRGKLLNHFEINIYVYMWNDSNLTC